MYYAKTGIVPIINGKVPEGLHGVLYCDGSQKAPNNLYMITDALLFPKLVHISGALGAYVYVLKFGTEQTIPNIDSISPDMIIPGDIHKDVEKEIVSNMKRALKEAKFVKEYKNPLRKQHNKTDRVHGRLPIVFASGSFMLGKILTGIRKPSDTDEIGVYRKGAELWEHLWKKSCRESQLLPYTRLLRQDDFTYDEGELLLSSRMRDDMLDHAHNGWMVIANEYDADTLEREKRGIRRKFGDNDMMGAVCTASYSKRHRCCYAIYTNRKGINMIDAERTGEQQPISVVYHDLSNILRGEELSVNGGLGDHVVSEHKSSGGRGGGNSKVISMVYLGTRHDTPSVILPGRNSTEGSDGVDKYGWPTGESISYLFTRDPSVATINIPASKGEMVEKLLAQYRLSRITPEQLS